MMMKIMISLGLVAATLAGCATTDPAPPEAGLVPSLREYVNRVAGELNQVPEDRRAVLREIAASVTAQLGNGGEAKLTFICTHNSRRSHMSQIWAQTAAYHYGLDRVHTFSGGTQTTECNCRTVTAMRTAGFAIKDATTGDNPVYQVYYAGDRPPIRAYSKIYNSDANPKADFIALMTCSSADKSCPTVEGAVARFAIHYADPKVCDDTPNETAAYNQRCREIAREMFFIMSEVRSQVAGR